MQKFMFLIREDLARMDAMSQEDMAASIRIMVEWTAKLMEGGNYVGGEPLESVSRLVEQNNVISDGPFIETKEGISGYMLVNASSIGQAVQLAQSCPEVSDGNIKIEVRPVMNF